MTRREYAGGAAPLVLAGSIGTSDTSIGTTGTATGWPTGGVGKFLVVIDRGLATEEKMLVTSRSGNTLTLSGASDRGQDDTASASHLAGASVEHVLGAIDLDEANEHINDITEDHHSQYMKADGTRHDLASRHLIGTTWAAPAAPVGLAATASAGDATDPARSNHVHPFGVYSDWTPAFEDTGSDTFGTGAVVAGRYTRVGNWVTGWGYVKLGSGFDSDQEGAWAINLPVAAREHASVNDSNLPIGYVEIKMILTGVRMHGIVSPSVNNNATFVMRYNDGSGAMTYVAGDSPDWENGSYFIFYFSYEAAA